MWQCGNEIKNNHIEIQICSPVNVFEETSDLVQVETIDPSYLVQILVYVVDFSVLLTKAVVLNEEFVPQHEIDPFPEVIWPSQFYQEFVEQP